MKIQVVGEGPPLKLTDGGAAWAVVWPGMGARFRSMHRISLPRSARTRELVHEVESVYYVLGGDGLAVDPAAGSTHSLVEGSMAFVEPGTRYVFEAGAAGLELVGGPCPPDPALY